MKDLNLQLKQKLITACGHAIFFILNGDARLFERTEKDPHGLLGIQKLGAACVRSLYFDLVEQGVAIFAPCDISNGETLERIRPVMS